MMATPQVIDCLIFTTLVCGGFGVLTLPRLDSRLTALKNDLDTEIKFREEDVKLLKSMIDDVEVALKDVLTNHGTARAMKSQISEKNITLWTILSKAFADEKMLNSRTRRMVVDVETLLSELTNFASGCENVDIKLDTNFNTIKQQSAIVSELQHKLIHDLNMISTEQHEHNGALQEISTLQNEHSDTLRKLSRLQQKHNVNLREIKEIIENGKADHRRFESCKALHADGKRISGIYQVYPDSRPSPITVYCDMEADGGGWTVFQRREDGAEQFYRDWLDYKHGFGHLEGEFWLGNMFLSQMTRNCCHELRIDMKDFNSNSRFAKYSMFQIGSNDHNYVLTAHGYSGDAGDSLSGHNGAVFSTKDRDNDKYEGSCAQSYKGAWWYTACHSSNLNGQYLKGKHESYADGVNWHPWLGTHYSLKYVDMKFR